jgi:solute carrier family 13 (sodium-dependent dicarboxylate transporter), member 2/3/5
MSDIAAVSASARAGAGAASPASSTADTGELTDLLDLSKQRLSTVKTRAASNSERWMRYLGFPGGVLLFLALYFMPTPVGLTAAGQSVIACFMLALVWWITEPFPTYVTSLCLMLLLVFFDGWPTEKVLGVLGLDVIWLNVMAFVLASILLKTNLAKRLALALLVKFGKGAMPTLFAFFLLQLALAPLIPATAARTIMTLPLMLVVAAIYGSSAEKPTNFGRNLFLQNLLGINIFSSGFMTGSTANIMAIAFILNMGGKKVYYSDWMFANLPVVLVIMLIAWVIGPKLLFRLKPDETKLRITGGPAVLAEYLKKMGPMSAAEKRGALIFGMVVFLWVTDRFHMGWFGFEINPVMAAMLGVILTFLPKIGILGWNEADIPWHLMIFSCGAYAGGMALESTGAARWVIGKVFDALHFGVGVNFWLVYVVVIAVMAYSHLVFTSKTMRTIILIPFIIATAQQLGFPALSLALPAAFTIDWVVGLPISAKPNVILFTTGQYSVLDNAKYGVLMTTIGVIVLTLAGFTWFRVLGITPGF